MLVLWERPANERLRYIATSSLIGRAHTHNDPCICRRPVHHCVVSLSSSYTGGAYITVAYEIHAVKDRTGNFKLRIFILFNKVEKEAALV